MPVREYLTLKQLIEMTKPFGCGRTLLYERFLTPAAKKCHRVKYTSQGHMRIPAEWAAEIVMEAERQFLEAPGDTSRLGRKLTDYRPCAMARCQKQTNRKDGICRICRATQ